MKTTTKYALKAHYAPGVLDYGFVTHNDEFNEFYLGTEHRPCRAHLKDTAEEWHDFIENFNGNTYQSIHSFEIVPLLVVEP